MRSRKESLLVGLEEIRKELLQTAESIKPEEFVWEPRPGMKSAKALLQEIGIEEKINTAFLAQGQILGWRDAVRWSGETLPAILRDLQKIREETLAFLKKCCDKDFEAPRPIPAPFDQWFGAEASPEPILGWVRQHEYYHLGQLIYNRWMLGYNPYETRK
jgi:uncharacterized damage-inducible protein DinB